MSELAALVDRHCHQEYTATAVPRLTLARTAATASLQAWTYDPRVYIVAGGRKRVLLGSEEFRYDAHTYLTVFTNLPVWGQVVEGPCLGAALTLEPARLAALLREMPAPPAPGQPVPARGLSVHRLGDELLEAVTRLVRLLDRPAHIPTLAPLVEREMLYHLLLGPQGEALRQFAQPESRLSQIGRAIETIRRRYDQTLPTAELARVAAMSEASFHRHFRAVTTMSPLQFQKQVRLQEARRRLLAADVDAAQVSFEVGYVSATQFSREYKRLFGLPPRKDAQSERRGVAKQRPGSGSVTEGRALVR